jgi:hypothetical protein
VGRGVRLPGTERPGSAADPVRNGAGPLHVAFVGFVTFVFFSVALVAFDRRDVRI